MKLAASEIRLLQAARKFIDGGEPYVMPYIELEGHQVSIDTAIDACEKYFHGSHSAYRLARERISRKLRESESGLFPSKILHGLGYAVWRYIGLGGGHGKIVEGNVSQETMNNWHVLARLAWIDRILETGEIR